MTDALTDRVAQIISRYNMLGGAGRVGVAVSGGADSVVLLRLLRRLLPGAELLVLHVNHKLRGAQSDEDQAFVRSLAESLGLPFEGETAPVTEGNLEAEARRLRREFFVRCVAKFGLERIALGHTRSDQAETVLHRFLRGSGVTGLSAMRFVSDQWLIRPLLTTSREEVRRWAEENGVQWREDSSNSDLRFTRNRLRLRTLPDLTRDYNRNLEAVLAGTAAQMQAEEEYWRETVEPVYAGLAERMRLGLILQSDALNRLPLALQRRILRRALAELQALRGLDFEHFESVLGLCGSTEGHDRVVIPGVDALRSFNSLLLSRAGCLAADGRGYCLELPVGETIVLPYGAGRICIRVAEPDPPICDTFKNADESAAELVRLNEEALAGAPLLVRSWQPGDELLRPGHRSTKKIKVLFQEHRTRLWERRHWPVIVSRGKVVWARQFGADSRFAVSGQTANEVQLAYRSVSSCKQGSSQ